MEVCPGVRLGRREWRGGSRLETLGSGFSWLVQPGEETCHLLAAGVGLEVGRCAEDCDFAIAIVTALLPSKSLIFLTDTFVVKINELAMVFQIHCCCFRGD